MALELKEELSLLKNIRLESIECFRWRKDDDLTTWSERVLEYIVKSFDALQASIYISRKRETTGKEYLQLIGCWGNLLTKMKMILQPGEGLVGQAYKAQRSFYLNCEAFDHYIETSMVRVKVRGLVVQPLVYDNRVEGILEFNTGTHLLPNVKDILQELAVSLAIQLQAYKTQEAIQRLYEEANEKNLLLKSQEEQLRKNLAELQATQQAMQVIQDNLELTVKNRTQELMEALENLKATQEQMILNEKLATLGQLVAGVAHEINTPIAAIKGSIENMMDYIPTIINKMPEVLAAARTEIRHLFYYFIQTCITETSTLSSKEERSLRRQYENELQALNIPEARFFASLLVSNGYRKSLEPLIPLLQEPNSKEIIQIATNLINLSLNMNIMNQAVDKTRKIVYSLKNFAHFQADEDIREINVNDSIEDILTLYHNQLKKGITVIRQYGEIPKIKGYADQIGQIWTNIIHNAIQAMNYQGVLTISTYALPQGVEVCIRDNGLGIPPELQEKIFEPFFTTKPKGEGTGIGLDIVKKILQKHNGKIRLESQPGDTAFFVFLPYSIETLHT
ncbi:MAG: ATP-binding protein [Bacteroidia bacterium]|nr:ATP-binding protein [Bacteroidia bacterium]MDW8159023.1 ATP-binding protein [Bacteroidia bacterium]